MNEPFDGNIDEEIIALPDYKKLIAFKRALIRVGVEFDEDAEGTIKLADPYEDLETEEFDEAFGEELKLIYIKSLFEGLEEDGLIKASGVEEDGSFNYELTPEGVEYAEEHIFEYDDE